MGHIVNSEREYRLLQQRLDYTLTGAPYSPVLIDILKLLFSPQEAEIARHIPLRPAPIAYVARKLSLPVEQVRIDIVAMAERGLVFDFEHKGECYVALAPIVIGFFEFVFMRTRGELPMKELAELFEQYMFLDDRFARDVFTGPTQLARAMVQEESLPTGDFTEVLDWEKATSVLSTSQTIGVSLCACRHKASHLGHSCDAPQRTCFTFNGSADMLIKKGMAEQIGAGDALKILEQCKDYGLAQLADNVQKNVGFICNCCGCCCGMFQAMKTYSIHNAIVTSNWLAEIDENTCKGCGACAKACPAEAISIKIDGNQRTAVRDEALCLGCGVCYRACKFNAIAMKPRPQRVLAPETTFDKYIAMALERGKLANLIFDDPSRLSHRALGRVAAFIEKSAPVKALMAVKPVRSAFLSTLAAGAKRIIK